MGKILKYCSSCEEGFAERFTFCPDCGASLQAVEVNPIASENGSGAEQPAPPVFISEPETTQTAPVDRNSAVITDHDHVLESFDAFAEVPIAIADSADTEVSSNGDRPSDDDILEVEEPVSESVEAAAEVPVSSSLNETAKAPNVLYTMPEIHADGATRPAAVRHDDGGFYVTVIQEKNTKQRNALLLGATGLVLAVVFSVVLIDLFQKDLFVGAIEDSPLFSAVLVDDVPTTVEEEPVKKDDKDGGGGGGGGKNEPTPASRGDLPDLSPRPTRPPDVNTPRMENPSLPLPPPQAEGPPLRTPKEYGRWGLPNGVDGIASNGPGTGGGIGSGTGSGVGSGRGTGIGSGTGSGMGGGSGTGIGDGTGGGGSGSAPPPIRAVTENYKILSRPKATYTDAARTNNVQGAVRLKVTLLASGQVGSITPVTRLPHGLTEQAIAAARQIRFEPKKVNGVPQSVIVTLEYTFNIY